MTMNDISVPMKPKAEKAVYDIGYWWYICPRCSKQINYQQEQCLACKQKIDWNDDTESKNDN